MRIKTNELERYDLTILHNGVDGIFAVKYDAPYKTPGPRLYEDKYNWRYNSEGNCYTLVIAQPAPSRVNCVVVVRRTSTNRYEATFASDDRCEFATVKTMGAVHEFLAPLLGRKA